MASNRATARKSSNRKAARSVPSRNIELDSKERAELEQLRAEKQNRYYLKVSQKGATSLYGVRRFPITFYVDEWAIIDEMMAEIREFNEKHEAQLTRR